MKKHHILLDNYLHGYQKMIAFYLWIFSLFGCLNYLKHPTDYYEVIFGLILLFFFYALSIVLFGKVGLYISDKNLYRGIAVANRFLFKEKVDTSDYSEFTYKKKDKTDLPWFLDNSMIGLFSNHYECSIFLVESDYKKRKGLISFSDFEMYYDVCRFLQRWTELREKK
ncbi:hypothetical protein R3X25_15020 [Lutibacter sp. TH_r2]|uniref:hypothetical protein n=1 Tax=Lutibacter sp. TH_r2 TaxID=3082083 RepID=UPI0029551A3E|nr:hypothetical protein [Lutibacter sp. TH_r2]MDV7188597.1 hypothetical protein [Lutibacter sp. TH_r2]